MIPITLRTAELSDSLFRHLILLAFIVQITYERDPYIFYYLLHTTALSSVSCFFPNLIHFCYFLKKFVL